MRDLDFADRHVLLSGVEDPGCQASLLQALLAKRAQHVTVVMALPPTTPHPEDAVETLSMLELVQGFRARRLPLYSAAIAGWEAGALGLGPDHFNPHADVMHMARLACATAPGARLLVALEGPGPDGADELLWTRRRRRYGRARTPLMLGWAGAAVRPVPKGRAHRRADGACYAWDEPGHAGWLQLVTGLANARLGNFMWALASLAAVAAQKRLRPVVRLSGTWDAQMWGKVMRMFPRATVEVRAGAAPEGPRLRERDAMSYDPALVAAIRPNCSVDGFLQSHRYFEGAEAHVRYMFRLRASVLRDADGFIARAKARLGAGDSVAVALHLRRGDVADHMGVSPAYWARALRHVRARHRGRNLTFLLVGGGGTVPDGGVSLEQHNADRAWARRHIPAPFVDVAGRAPRRFRDPAYDEAFDLAVMARCAAVVISGGTYGFWGAFFNGRVCVAPNCALCCGNVFNYDDYYPRWCTKLPCT